ncbi:MAG: 3-keto-disaccharide hydrolase, partial [Fimbriiglobus sp.]
MRLRNWAAAAVVVAAGAVAAVAQREYKSGIVWPEPVVVTPGATAANPPSDAVVLFDGKDLSKWKNGEKWDVKDGYAVARKTGIETTDKFGDVQLHLEFATPEKVTGSGQGRGNSGLFFHGVYEVQILDSFENATYFDGQCASLYKQTPPMVNACRKPGEWQTYDVVFEAPRFADDGKLEKPAVVTVLQNGVLVQNHFELQGGTFYDRPPAYKKHPPTGPISLQFHGNPV